MQVVMALLKIIVSALLIYVVIKVESHLESRVNEMSGNRTDLLVLGSITLIVIFAICIVYNLYVIVKPIINMIIRH